VDGRRVSVGSVGLPAVDTTGTGDQFAAAFAWAQLLGAEAELSVLWANLYAGLSVGSHTAVGGALHRAQLLEEGARRGLPELPTATVSS
jgi:sugar/nucleoside kinase (ribokinase family)